MKDKQLYFAYGSNMNVEQMMRRCPDAKKYCNGYIRGYQVIINSRGVATIIKSSKNTVEGVVWAVSDSDIKELDKREGVSRGHYNKNYMRIHTKFGVEQCLVYIASDSKPGEPRPGYLDLIRQGAIENKLSERYQKLVTVL